MGKRTEELREAFTPVVALVLVVYGLYRMLAYSSYVTNFGTFDGALAYVSNAPFMGGAAIGNLLSCIIIFALYATGRLRAGGLDVRVPLVLVAAVYVFPLVAPVFASEVFSLTGLGVLWGLTTTIVACVGAELLACTPSPVALIVQLAVSSLFMALLGPLLNALPDPWGTIVYAAIALALIPLVGASRKRVVLPPPAAKPLRAFRSTLRNSFTPIMAAAFFELVVGLVNMFAVHVHSAFTISSSAPEAGAIICAVLVTAFVLVAERAPQVRVIYLGVFPAIIAVFLLLPFFGEALSQAASNAIYAAYAFTTLLSSFCYLRACREAGDCAYGIAAFMGFVMRLFLIVGLALGWYFGTFTEGEAFVHVSIVCVVSVYMLGMMAVWWAVKSAREKRVVEVVEVVVERVPETFEQSVASRVDELVKQYNLTTRERDVLVGIAQGHTAASIAKGLHLSTSTVQGYIKSLYVKLGVSKKQQVIDLFQN